MRTAIGIAVLTFYVVLFIAGSLDIGAQRLAVSVPAIMWTLRIALIVLPPITGWIALKLAHDLQGGDRLEEVA